MAKKKFNETKFGQFLSKAKNAVPDIASAALQVASGDLKGAVNSVSEALNLKVAQEPDNNEAKRLQMEFERSRNEFELEMYQLEVQDRESARKREVELAKSGKSDWMMSFVGVAGLALFAASFYALVWVPQTVENKLFVHFLGIIEGAVLSIYGYYFGTSKSSSDKTKMLNRD